MGTNTRTHTRTSTYTVEEKFILQCLEEANKDEIPVRAIVSRANEAQQDPNFTLRLDEELILTCIGQLIERGKLNRIEIGLGEYTYGRAW